MIKCKGSGDCDTCYNINECNKHVVCDECNEVIAYEGDTNDGYYEINGDHYCKDCLDVQFLRRSI